VTTITETERPNHLLRKLDVKAIPQPLPPVSSAKEPLAAELDPTQSASVQLAPGDLTHGDRRRETASLQLLIELLNGRLPLAAALDASVAPDDALIVSPLALGLGLFPRRQKTSWLVQETHPGSALGPPFSADPG
jgi:hypothetical protein